MTAVTKLLKNRDIYLDIRKSHSVKYTVGHKNEGNFIFIN